MPPKGVRGGGRGRGRGGRGRGRREEGANESTIGGNSDIATIIAEQLATLIPNIVTQVTNAIGNSNGGQPERATLGNNGNGGNGCTYKEFMACRPREFDGKGGALAYTSWIEKIEAVIDISNCAEGQRVKYTASSLSGKALTWWNTQIQAMGRETAVGMPWDEFKEMMKKEFCPGNEMQKLEQEFWNHSMEGAKHAAYTDRFHELAKLVPHLVTPESKRIERYIYGLVPEIRGMVSATDPPTIQSAILKAGTLTNEMVRVGSLTKGGGKRKEGDSSKHDGTGSHKKFRNGKHYAATTTGNPHPKCTTCRSYHHPSSACHACFKCNKLGHFAKDCREPRLVVPIRATYPHGTLHELKCFKVQGGGLAPEFGLLAA